jgi:histidine ammonia-lyase
MPLKLSAPEKQALLSGTELSTAFALAGLFEAERVFQSALVAGAMSAAAARLPGAVLHPRVDRLSRQPGRSEVAATYRALLGVEHGQAARGHAESSPEVTASRRFSAQMGACIDLVRQAGDTLARAGNAASEETVVLWQTGELVAGLEDTSSVTFAADQIALALRELGTLAERRIGALSVSAGAVPGSRALELMAAGFTAEMRERACHAKTASNAEGDYPMVSAPAAPRLLRVAGATSLVVVIELLAAARACDRAEAPGGSEALAKVRDLLRDVAPQAQDENGISPADLAGAAELVRSGALAGAAGIDLPSLEA